MSMESTSHVLIIKNAIRLQENDADNELKEAFKVFDKDQDGYISPNEV